MAKCYALPAQIQTCGYLFSSAYNAITLCRHQIKLFADRGAWARTTYVEMLLADLIASWIHEHLIKSLMP